MNGSPEKERLLEAVVNGEVAANDAKVRSIADSDPEFESELRTLLATRDLLDRAGGEESAVMRAIAADAGSGRRRQRWDVFYGLAAAMLGIVLFLWSPWQQDETRFLGGEIRVAAPAEVGGPFTFAFTLPPGGWFDVRVDDADNPGGPALDVAPRLPAASWRPDPARQADWPAVVVLTVTAYDGMGDEVADGQLLFVR